MSVRVPPRQVRDALLLLADGFVAAADLPLQLADVLLEVLDGLRQACVLRTHPNTGL